MKRGSLNTIRTAILIRLVTTNHSNKRIAADLDTTLGRVAAVRYNMGQGLYRNMIEGIKRRHHIDPPSPAMVRLAQFDPVIARALRQKLGE